MIIFKKALHRRTFLRGFGASLALPLLDAMVPAMTALAAMENQARKLTVTDAVARMVHFRATVSPCNAGSQPKIPKTNSCPITARF